MNVQYEIALETHLVLRSQTGIKLRMQVGFFSSLLAPPSVHSLHF